MSESVKCEKKVVNSTVYKTLCDQLQTFNLCLYSLVVQEQFFGLTENNFPLNPLQSCQKPTGR